MDSNLFKIDFDAIERVLADANAQLIDRVKYTIRKIESLPSEAHTKADIENVKIVLGEIRQLSKDVRKARLSDGRPFSEATKRVKKWFASWETTLSSIDATLSQNLEEAAKRASSSISKGVTTEGAKDFEPIGVSIEGELVVQATSDPGPEPEEPPLVPLSWQPVAFDRHLIGLEELRPFLTDNAIMMAIRKHMEVNGPNTLKGVTYERKLKKDLKIESPPSSNQIENLTLSSKKPGKAGQPWPSAEDKALKNAFETGASIPELAIVHQRSRGAIRSRLVKLGLVDASSQE